MTTTAEQTSEKWIDDFLAVMHLCEEDSHDLCVSLRNMDGAVPIGVPTLKSRWEDLKLFTEVGEISEWPLNSVMALPVATVNGFPTGDYVFERVRSIQTKEARAIGATLYSQKMIMHERIYCSSAGQATSGMAPFALFGKKWVLASNSIGAHLPPEGLNHTISLVSNLSLTMRYEWSVWIGFSSGPRVRFITDPTGAMHIFKLRDAAPGRARRSALRNWVVDHHRKKRSDPDAEILIRRHLRGETAFTWNGMRCLIQPPAFDTERLAERTSK
jgi:hypothetical protein